MLCVIHAWFSLKEECLFREVFYKERTIHTLKESFEGTLEALPEPLIVKTEGNTVYSNSAFREQLEKENFKEEVDKVLNENAEIPLEEAREAAKKITLG